MSSASPLAQSVHARLIRIAHRMQVDPNLILARYASERLLYRLSRSRHADRFVLKGAMLLVVWIGDMVRPTRDVDLLGFGDLDEQYLGAIFGEVAAAEVEADGVAFDPASVTITRIREEDVYGGRRVIVLGSLGPARLRVQIDIGVGDAVYPEPQVIDYPALLDLPAPRLRAYSPETAVAEKLHAMVILGSKNSRMRDFFDIRALARHEPFDGGRLAGAIRATFDRRVTTIPERPLALTAEFAELEGKRAQWKAFLRKHGLPAEDFGHVVNGVREFLGPPIEALKDAGEFDKKWPPGGPWS